MKLTANAMRVLESRYLHRDGRLRVIETPEQLFLRVARAVAVAEYSRGSDEEGAAWQARFQALMSSLDFLPNSPALMNAGVPMGQLSACFVLPVPDSMEGIFDAMKTMALVQRTGGGTGFSFSNLRPRDDLISSAGGQSSGPVSFIRVFDCATEHIRQGGRRRGANMGVLRVDHPDILEFIDAKQDERTLRNFNLSVGITDHFMEACDAGHRFSLLHPRNQKPVATLAARELFDRMVQAAWRTGDPGLLFLDAINRANPTPQLGDIESSNPCGEVPLLPYESCNLGSINLAHMVAGEAGRTSIDWEKLRRTVHLAVRFLDDMIDVNRYPLNEIREMSQGNRKIGLGVMGFAEALIRLGLPYDTAKAVDMADQIMSFIRQEAIQMSGQLAEERGLFPNWAGSRLEADGARLRNATVTAIAPTGSIGIIADTSPGIEPLFALSFRRSHVLEDQQLSEANPLLAECLERYNVDAMTVLKHVAEKGTLEDVPGVPEDLRRLFVTALEIDPEWHLQMQAAFQRHVDNSVSKTINLAEDATPRDVARIYRRAWELKLKGITVYRYGSKARQVMELGTAEGDGFLSPCNPRKCPP